MHHPDISILRQRRKFVIAMNLLRQRVHTSISDLTFLRTYNEDYPDTHFLIQNKNAYHR